MAQISTALDLMDNTLTPISSHNETIQTKKTQLVQRGGRASATSSAAAAPGKTVERTVVLPGSRDNSYLNVASSAGTAGSSGSNASTPHKNTTILREDSPHSTVSRMTALTGLTGLTRAQTHQTASPRPAMGAKSKSSASVLRHGQERRHTKAHSASVGSAGRTAGPEMPGRTHRFSLDTQRAVRRNTGEYRRSNILFKARSHHSQIFPVMDSQQQQQPHPDPDSPGSSPGHDRRTSTYTMNSLPVYQLKGGRHLLDSSSSLPPMLESNTTGTTGTTATTTTTNSSGSSIEIGSSFASVSSRLSVRPGSAVAPLKTSGHFASSSRTTFSSPLRRHTTIVESAGDGDTGLQRTGHRIDEGDVNFNIVYDMLTGIRYTVSSRLKHAEKHTAQQHALTSRDFTFSSKLIFDRKGSEPLQDSILTQYEFKFKDYAPRVFKELRRTFGIDEREYLESLTSKYVLNELNSPGKSGSFFYYSRDYKYIIKTIHHGEHTHLRKTLAKYHAYVEENPNTLICQFYGLHRIKLPITFKSGIKNKKVYFIVMNNLFPPGVRIDTTFDLKGSLWGRYTKIPDHAAGRYSEKRGLLSTGENSRQQTRSDGSRIILKDLNWLVQEERLHFDSVADRLLLKQLERDVQLLARMNTMDYSLLVGIHFIERDDAEGEDGAPPFFEDKGFRTLPRSAVTQFLQQGDASELPLNLFTHFDGGLLSLDTNSNGDQMIYYIGIIDCLTNYSVVKRLETLWRGINHKLEVVSAIPPRHYADRFYKFIENSVRSNTE